MEASSSSQVTPIIQKIIVEVPSTDISTIIVAWLGLGISLLTFAFQLYQYWNNKGKLKITVHPDLGPTEIDAHGMVKFSPSNIKFWSVLVTNIGSKNLTITSISLLRKSSNEPAFVTRDYHGKLSKYVLPPYEIYSYMFNYKQVDPLTIKEVHIVTASGIYKKKL